MTPSPERAADETAPDARRYLSKLVMVGLIYVAIDADAHASDLAATSHQLTSIGESSKDIPSKRSDFTPLSPNQALAERAAERLRRLRIPGSGIEVRTFNETVTLVGEVPSSAFGDLAAQSVAAVPGVRSVENQLRVSQDLAKPRANQAIAESVEFVIKDALEANGFRRYSLEVIVEEHGQSVQLTGFVLDPGHGIDRVRQAALAGLQIPDVNSIVTKITVIPIGARPAFELADVDANLPPIEAPKPNSTDGTVAISSGRIVVFSVKR